jgi:hypothetical protein
MMMESALELQNKHTVVNVAEVTIKLKLSLGKNFKKILTQDIESEHKLLTEKIEKTK